MPTDREALINEARLMGWEINARIGRTASWSVNQLQLSGSLSRRRLGRVGGMQLTRPSPRRACCDVFSPQAVLM
ncbi:MAG: hypothetical protein OXI60_00795 [Acidiferrobacterales bacterium]|nr:hypothetical protein [Acidiferrobacterales bacterium]